MKVGPGILLLWLPVQAWVAMVTRYLELFLIGNHQVDDHNYSFLETLMETLRTTPHFVGMKLYLTFKDIDVGGRGGGPQLYFS